MSALSVGFKGLLTANLCPRRRTNLASLENFSDLIPMGVLNFWSGIAFFGFRFLNRLGFLSGDSQSTSFSGARSFSFDRFFPSAIVCCLSFCGCLHRSLFCCWIPVWLDLFLRAAPLVPRVFRSVLAVL